MSDVKETLFVTDAELIRRLGVPEKQARRVIQDLDRKQRGFPRKQKLWGDRRYWPDVVAYLDRTCGLRMGVSRRRDVHD